MISPDDEELAQLLARSGVSIQGAGTGPQEAGHGLVELPGGPSPERSRCSPTDELESWYRDGHYRPSPLLRRAALTNDRMTAFLERKPR